MNTITTHKPSIWHLIPVALILIVAFGLRMNGLNRMDTMLSTDEAYDSGFGLSLLAEPRLIPFFDTHLGEESGFMYVLAASLLLGIRPFSVHFGSALLGLLTVAAVYRLARQLFSRQVALYATLAMSVLMMHVILNHIVLRHNLQSLLGTLAFAFLIQAMRSYKVRHWVLAGILFGLSTYTYYPQVAWLGLTVIIQLIWMVRDKASRRMNLLALGLTALVAAPLAIHLFRTWGYASQHMSDVSRFGPGEIAHNVVSWIFAWLYQGSGHLHDNPPFRPILDIPLALAFYTGVFTLALTRVKRWRSVFLFTITLAGISPSLVTDQAPSFFRTIYLCTGLALIAGAGSSFLAERLKPLRAFAPALPAALLLWSGVNTYRDTQTWLSHPDMYVLMEQHINTASQTMQHTLPPDRPVYFSPFAADHPNVVFAAARLSPRPVAAFESASCIVMADTTATYFSLPKYDLDFQEQLSQWADIQPVTADPGAPLPWVVFDATPKSDLLKTWQGENAFGFADLLSAQLMQPLPNRASPGDAVELWIGARPLAPIDLPYRVFVHLYGDPTPYEGGPLLAQSDQPLCPPYTADRWRLGETAITRLALNIPPDLQPGQYIVSIGIYNGDTLARLPVTQPAGGPDYVEIAEIAVR